MESPGIDAGRGALGHALSHQGIHSFGEVLHYLHYLPYQRISDPEDCSLVLAEGRGTCSTKHALLKALAREQGWPGFALILCMYGMHERNTPGIGAGIARAGLAYLPEAHCYVRYRNEDIDITRPGASIERIRPDILAEIEISPAQVGRWKRSYHRQYLQNWISEQKITYSLDEIWSIREDCIAALAQ